MAMRRVVLRNHMGGGNEQTIFRDKETGADWAGHQLFERIGQEYRKGGRFRVLQRIAKHNSNIAVG